MNFNELDCVILKTLISNKKYANEFVQNYDAKLFSPEIWVFAERIVKYIKNNKDLPTLRVILEKLPKNSNAKLLENITQTWNHLDSIKYNSLEFNHDLEKLKTRFAEKQVSMLRETLSKIDPASFDISKATQELQKTIQSVKDLNKNQAFEVKNVKDYLSVFVEKFNNKKENPDLEIGLQTKYSYFDFATNGLKAADYVLICGESGFGKSMLLNNMAVQSWMQDNTLDSVEFKGGKDIIYFSLEMPYEDCFNRLLAKMTGVPSRDIENAKLSKEQFLKVKKALDFIKKYPYSFKIVDISDACADDLEHILNNSEEKFDAIFVDYLGIMRPNNGAEESDWLSQGKISQELRSICRRYKVPLFSAVQLNRKTQGKDSSENIGLNRLARSATIATHATHVLQIISDSKSELRSHLDVHIIKNRKSAKGKFSLIKNLAAASLIDVKSDEIVDNTYSVNDEDLSSKLEKANL